MIELPEEFELIAFFECEPHLASPGTPWVYNSITFENIRGEDLLRFRIEPDFGEIQFTWVQAGITRINFKLNDLASISIHMANGDEHLIASGGDADPQQLVKVRLKPAIAVEWSSIRAFI